MGSPRRSRAQHCLDAAWHEREAEAGVPEWDRGVRHWAGLFVFPPRRASLLEASCGHVRNWFAFAPDGGARRGRIILGRYTTAKASP